MPSIRPLHDNVLVKRIDAVNATPSGIIIPDNAKEKPLEAIVIAVGPGRRDENGVRVACDVVAGERVMFSRCSGSEVKLEGVDHIVLRETDILAVLA